MELREHQIKAVEMLRDSIRRGNKKIILAAPCSFGKTITAVHILLEAAKKGKRGIFICDRIKLVEQTLDACDRHNIDVGVIQGRHWRTDYRKQIQVASIQTLARLPYFPDFDVAVIDECHVHYETTDKMMKLMTNNVFIGLSATPFSKGLGLAYDDLVVPITPTELLEQGFLCPVSYYGGKHANLDGMKMKKLPTGGRDYDEKALALAYEGNTAVVGDIIQNWKKWGEGRQTIAFSPSIKHSQFMVTMFREAGIKAEHIDGYMDLDERQWLYQAHDAGEFQILSCSRLLNAGYDAPSVSCLIDCFPTSSLISFIQRSGRIARISDGKEKAIYLDHAGNIQRHGLPELVCADSLDTNETRFSEREQITEKEPAKVWACPVCYQSMAGPKCHSCGYEIRRSTAIQTDDQILQEIKIQRKSNKIYSPERKAEWLGELQYYEVTRGYKHGWASHKYRAKFGVWPNKIDAIRAYGVSDEVKSFIQSQNIRYTYRRDANGSGKHIGEAS